jgi:beta-1,4-mannosyl-glycoprotein beta-1,4-N-acetylglucosaminyltransferase
MKIFDCFKFFNELELLHLRFMEYYDYVDYFVIVESTKSHTGKTKELIFQNNKHLFEKYLDKVVHVVVEDLPDYDINNIWIPENFQRNCIKRGLNGLAKNGDKIFISDCDEFWDVDIAKKYIDRDSVTFYQELYYYYVNCKQKQFYLYTTNTLAFLRSHK